jgi:hypothetical protein
MSCAPNARAGMVFVMECSNISYALGVFSQHTEKPGGKTKEKYFFQIMRNPLETKTLENPRISIPFVY